MTSDQKRQRRAWEGELVLRCGRLDPDAWCEFVRCFESMIQRAIIRLLRAALHRVDREEVQDLTQEVYRSLLVNGCRRLLKFNPERAGLARYLTLRVRQRVCDFLRRQVVRRLVHGQALPEEQLLDRNGELDLLFLYGVEFVPLLNEKERYYWETSVLGKQDTVPPARWRERQRVRVGLTVWRKWGTFLAGD